MQRTNGLHHITAISGNAQQHIDFYTEGLGLRLVKLTVNFDDPSVYHTYFADIPGTPGTVLTFFPWEGIRRGRVGVSQTAAISFAAPMGSLDEWVERLAGAEADVQEILERFGERVLRLHDPEGLPLELVETERQDPRVRPWTDGSVPTGMALAGFEGVTLAVRDVSATAAVLTGLMGYRELGREGSRIRYITGDGFANQVVDLLELPHGTVGTMGYGTVHHVAFRVADDEVQETLRREAMDAGLMPSEMRDRQYFHSVYFREPNGVLFELATEGPGFTIDENEAELGSALRLPPQYESHRRQIEAHLPSLILSQTGRVL
ncbi:MAG: ring-cleaving dioxygenase [bacterium]